MIMGKVFELEEEQNIIDRFEVSLRRKEMSSHLDDDAVEIGAYLSKILSHEEDILLLHKTFWKSALSQDMSTSTLIDITEQIASKTSLCATMLSNLNARKKDKTILRTYANFMETFLMEKEYAEELYEVSQHGLLSD